ncbi:maleylpyruvate isomerase family mycothiol-dependent enzyme [Actinophytocola gossypii]|uniref:Maleylpyruvate isomerase family mycothiol-dependent enzyme n=1 Tax=Actinophytocola gossypii TaxID=2812003 RepID=A0ABT2J7D2_9PSEU|nr:maleylpyruvate isomerase family mycothiol-dependent enzyme [Actinophytocola gossypii]MCT2583760.1 maleylpyruvate isomerase family mycothiol-dependent enzyme [Actinophytocola gossypii]
MDTSLYEAGRPTLRAARSPNHVAYRQVRQNVLEVLSGDPGNPTVPSCPEWTVRDLLAHLVGSAALAVGRMSGWPSTHPSSSSGMGVPELLDAWDRLGAEVDLLLADRGARAGNLLVTDAFTHELDLRYAVGAPMPADHLAFAGAFEVLANGFSAAVTAHHLPALRLSTGSTRWTVGDGEPVATVTADRHDLYRSLAGRRSHSQITALGWDRDSHRWLPAFSWGPFSPPESPVE